MRAAERHATAAAAAVRGEELDEQLNAAVRRLRALRAYNAALQVRKTTITDLHVLSLNFRFSFSKRRATALESEEEAFASARERAESLKSQLRTADDANNYAADVARLDEVASTLAKRVRAVDAAMEDN